MRPDASENSQISPSTIVRAARAAGSHPQLASVLLQGRKSANIHASSGVIRGTPVKSVLPFVDPAAEKTPMTRVPYVRQIIAQLHVATVFEHEQRCHGVAGREWSSRSQKVFDGQNLPSYR